jgi:hypothetical protein
MWLDSNSFEKRSRQSGLADPRLAGKQHHLPFAGLRFGPAPAMTTISASN